MLPGRELLTGREFFRAVRLDQLFNLVEDHLATLVSEKLLELRFEELKSVDLSKEAEIRHTNDSPRSRTRQSLLQRCSTLQRNTACTRSARDPTAFH